MSRYLRLAVAALAAGVTGLAIVTVAAADWPMAAANPQRTSWTADSVPGALTPLWSVAIGPYISQKVQVIAAEGLLYIATARGLYALDAETGRRRWVYATELPLGHAPTIAEGVAYVGGFDRKLHAIGARDGRPRWTFSGTAGFSTNPLVVEATVYAGCRDGSFYAVDAKSGALRWKFLTGGPILFSAACQDGAVFFASNDSHAYALEAKTGRLVWKSAKLPGAGFHSWWPVVYRDRVVLAGSRNYRSAISPGMNTLYTGLELADVYPAYKQAPGGTPIGQVGQEPGDWATGTTTINAQRILDYLKEKPWRQTCMVLDRATGQERELAPMLWFGTHSGNRYPPVVGGDGVLYQADNFLSSPWIAGGGIVGWKFGTPWISVISSNWRAVDEPMAYSAGGNLIYWTLCCNRGAGAIDISKPNARLPGTKGGGPKADREWSYFGYNHNRVFPGLYEKGWRFNCSAHNDQNPPIPYQGRVYVIRYNAVHCFAREGKYPPAVTADEPVPERFQAKRTDAKPTFTGLAIDLQLEDGQWPALVDNRDLMYRRRKREGDGYVCCHVGAGDKERPRLLQANRGGDLPSTASFTLAGDKKLSVKVFPRGPGVWFDTDRPTYRIEGTFTALAYQGAAGPQVVRGPGSVGGADMAAGWLLLWAGGDLPRLKPYFALNDPIREDAWHHTWLRSGMPRFRPILIVLEKKPISVDLTEKGLRIAFDRPAGKLIAAPLWGLHNPDPRQALAWHGQLPAEVAQRCRLLDRVVRAAPAETKDDWQIDPQSGDAVLTTTCRHETMAGEWGVEPLRLAYLPPPLALAAWGGPPIRVSSPLVDLDYALPLGRLCGVADADRVVATLPALARYWRDAPAEIQRPAVASDDPLLAELVGQIEKMLAAGHLRPGYHGSGIFDAASTGKTGDYTVDYFHNPADTIYTLIRALPLLPGPVRQRTRDYLRREFAAYPPHSISHIGWTEGAPREVFLTPPEFEADKTRFPAGNRTWSNWGFPPQNFYALWMFAREFGEAKEVFAPCRSKLEVKPRRFPASMPFMLNSHIAGQAGYYRLARLAGVPPADLAEMERSLAELLVLRAALMKCPESLGRASYEYGGHRFTINSFDPASGEVTFAEVKLGGFPLYNFTLHFLNLVPELGRFLAEYARPQVAASVADFEERHPYWFVAKGEDTDGEGTLQPLHDTVSSFQAKAQILGESRPQLEKYLDVPGFERGDLFYLQNLIAVLEAAPAGGR